RLGYLLGDLNPGERHVPRPIAPYRGPGAERLALGDLDGDGDLDVAVTTEQSHDVSVLINRGDGTIEDHRVYGTGQSPRDVVAVDMDGDGDLDLVTANYEGRVRLDTAQPWRRDVPRRKELPHRGRFPVLARGRRSGWGRRRGPGGGALVLEDRRDPAQPGKRLVRRAYVYLGWLRAGYRAGRHGRGWRSGCDHDEYLFPKYPGGVRPPEPLTRTARQRPIPLLEKGARGASDAWPPVSRWRTRCPRRSPARRSRKPHVSTTLARSRAAARGPSRSARRGRACSPGATPGGGAPRAGRGRRRRRRGIEAAR